MDTKKAEKGLSSKFIHSRIFFFALLFLLLISSIIFTWKTYKDKLVTQEQEAVFLARSAASQIPQSYLKKLDNNLSDLEKNEYIFIKNSLLKFVEISDQIRFAYFMVLKDGNIVITADSESKDSEDYSPPGQIFKEAKEWDYIPFEQKIPAVSDPLEDRWGRWISVLVPVLDINTNDVLAVFGLDYPAKFWYSLPAKNAIQSAILSLCIMAMIVVLYTISLINMQLRQDRQLITETDNRLKESMTLYKAVFDQTTIGIAVADKYKYLIETDTGLPSINSAFEVILGKSKEEIAKTTWIELTYHRPWNRHGYFDKFKAGLIGV